MLMHQKPPHDALKRCISVSTDINEQAGRLTNWKQEYDQCSPGQFYGRIDECQLQRVQVFKEHTSQVLRQHCVIWPEAVWIGIPRHRDPFRINGQEVEHDDIMWRLGEMPFELVTPEACDIFSLVVHQDDLQQLARIQGVELDLQQAASYPRLRVRRQLVTDLTLLIEQVLAYDNQRLAIDIHADLLVMQLLELLRDARVNPAVIPSYPHRKAVVERVRAYIDAAGDRPVTMTHLCEVACVSRRTLQYSFESILGLSPLQFLRISRLNRVRRMLSSQQAPSVSDAAAYHGFYHLGQFSTDYKRLFGELPSQTLHSHSH